MIVSDARREANRRNALQSSGPKTEAGKAQAAQNALKHGFTAQRLAIGPEAEQALAERVALWRAQYQPDEGWQSWLVEELAGVTLRLGRIAQVENQLRTVAAGRAEDEVLWDQDRRLAAEQIGARLERNPAQVVAQLRRTPHGCDWLIERWAGLARLADTNGGWPWDAEQTRLAHDLLATPATSRAGTIGQPIDEDGRSTGSPPMPAVLARREITQLQTVRDVVSAADELARTMVTTGSDDVPTRDIATLRRYERTTLRRLYWLTDQMHAAGLAPPTRQPQPTAAAPAAIATPAPAASLEVAQTPESPSPEVAPQVERNEPIATSANDETNPLTTAVPADSTPMSLVLRKDPPRNRPDLAKLTRRAQHERHHQKRNRRSA